MKQKWKKMKENERKWKTIWENERKMKETEARKKKDEKKRKRGPKGVPPETGPKIDFLHKNCQEKS